MASNFLKNNTFGGTTLVYTLQTVGHLSGQLRQSAQLLADCGWPSSSEKEWPAICQSGPHFCNFTVLVRLVILSHYLASYLITS